MRLKLARFGIVPPGNVTLRKKMFAHAERRDVRQPAGFLPHRLGV